ncbi:MAG: pseudouridine-5'-phosphate glycosidase [Pseudomonadota bacterium]
MTIAQMQTNQTPFVTSATVTAALAANRPVVALESTIITHGMPWPENLNTARSVEDAVRSHGAEPATIAVMDGTLHIGLEPEAMEALAANDEKANAPAVMKLSRADLPYAMAMGRTGSTTVAATMIAAAAAGIDVFATGGIGGVHRGAEESFDVSADLQELARSPVTVVCAGAKAILDLPKTLEVLETLGVPVVGYQTDELPAFWSRESGLAAPLRADTPGDIATFHSTRQSLGLSGGILIANPLPADAALPRDTIESWIEGAMAAAIADDVKGKAVTPYLLAKINDLSAGRSLAANQVLIIENAKLAAQIAVALKGQGA